MGDLQPMSALQRWAMRTEAARNDPEAWAKYEAEDAAWQASEERLRTRPPETAGEFLVRCGAGELEVDVLTGEGVEDSPARVAAKDWLASDKAILLLHGGPGSGKTVAAVEALLQFRGDGQVRDLHAGQFLKAGALARRSYYDSEAFESDARAKLLILDDLGQEQMAGPFAATLDDLLDERIRRRKRTIITTNLDVQAFAARYAKPGSRLASRLAAHATVASAGARDLRREAANG